MNTRTDVATDLRTREMKIAGGKSTGRRIKSYDPKTRTADVMISTGVAVVRRDPWTNEEWHELLEVSPKAVRLERLNSGAPIIDAHNYTGGMDSMLGAIVPGSARIVDGQLWATAKFSRSGRGQRVAQDLEDDIPISVSVGYKTHKEAVNARSVPATRTAVDWEPIEVSIAPIPAEAGAGFRQHEHQGIEHRSEHGVENMTEEEKRAFAEAEAKKQRDDAAAAAAAEEDAESEKKKKEEEDAAAADAAPAAEQRALDLRARNRTATLVELGAAAKVEATVVSDAIKRGLTPDQFSRELIARLAGKDTRVTSGISANRVGVGRDNAAEGRVEAASEALVTRVLSSRRMPAVATAAQAEWIKAMGRTDMIARSLQVIDGHAKPNVERTRAYLDKGFADIAAECLGYTGNIRGYRQADDIIRRAFNSTSDFPAIFENVMNKSLLARYQLSMPTYRQLGAERPFNDFRPHSQVRAGDMPTLVEVNETGELQSGSSLDSKESVTVKAYGRKFAISRIAIVNDEMGAIDQMLSSWGDVVLIFENTTFFNMMIGNPVLNQDSAAVWATAHNNLAASGATISVTTLDAARAAMRAQKSLSGNFINVPPAILLTGPKSETAADQIVTSITPTLVGSVNPFSGKLRSVSDANITDGSWYIFAEPNAVPNFVYGFLNGSSGPRIRTDEPFGVQGVQMSIEHDFGCGAIDFRATYKNPGV